MSVCVRVCKPLPCLTNKIMGVVRFIETKKNDVFCRRLGLSSLHRVMSIFTKVVVFKHLNMIHIHTHIFTRTYSISHGNSIWFSSCRRKIHDIRTVFETNNGNHYWQLVENDVCFTKLDSDVCVCVCDSLLPHTHTHPLAFICSINCTFVKCIQE